MTLRASDIRELRTAADMQGLSQEFAAVMDEIDAQRELLRLCRAERDDLAAEVYLLRAALRGLHDAITRWWTTSDDLSVSEEMKEARAALGE